MKKTIRMALAMLAAAAVILTSCGKEDGEVGADNKSESHSKYTYLVSYEPGKIQSPENAQIVDADEVNVVCTESTDFKYYFGADSANVYTYNPDEITVEYRLCYGQELNEKYMGKTQWQSSPTFSIKGLVKNTYYYCLLKTKITDKNGNTFEKSSDYVAFQTPSRGIFGAFVDADGFKLEWDPEYKYCQFFINEGYNMVVEPTIIENQNSYYVPKELKENTNYLVSWILYKSLEEKENNFIFNAYFTGTNPLILNYNTLGEMKSRTAGNVRFINGKQYFITYSSDDEACNSYGKPRFKIVDLKDKSKFMYVPAFAYGYRLATLEEINALMDYYNCDNLMDCWRNFTADKRWDNHPEPVYWPYVEGGKAKVSNGKGPITEVENTADVNFYEVMLILVKE